MSILSAALVTLYLGVGLGVAMFLLSRADRKVASERSPGVVVTAIVLWPIAIVGVLLAAILIGLFGGVGGDKEGGS